MLKKLLKRIYKDQKGITGLETAIILIAFVVVASVFAYTVLSAGIFSSEKGKETVYSGLSATRGTLEPKGSVVASGDAGTPPTYVDNVVFVIANAVNGEAINLTTGANKVTVISYFDQSQRVADATWTKTWLGKNDGDDLLELGEKAEITVDLSALSPTLQTNTEFTIEVKPPKGATLTIERTTPAKIDKVMDLH